MNDVLDLFRRARRVDARWAAARHHRRMIDDRPLGAIESEDADLPTARKAERHHRACGRANLLAVRLPRRRLPASVDLGLVRDRRRPVRCHAQHAMRNRVASHVVRSLVLLRTGEIRRRALLALRLQRAIRDQLADRQCEILRRRAELLVDLLDPQPWMLRHERVEAIRHLVELCSGSLATAATSTPTPQTRERHLAALAERFVDHVASGRTGELGDLGDEVGDDSIHLTLEIAHWQRAYPIIESKTMDHGGYTALSWLSVTYPTGPVPTEPRCCSAYERNPSTRRYSLLRKPPAG